MIRIEMEAWEVMLSHAHSAYPRECCGILLGKANGSERVATQAIACHNAYEGDQKDRFLLDPKDQVAAERRAREIKLDVLGFFHSHPDCDAYFSATDLANSWPWYSNIVISVHNGAFHHARAFVASDDQTASTEEELQHPR